MVVHVGDITQTQHEEEWEIADIAFKPIDNHVPYILCSGNHDMGYSLKHRETSHSRTSLFGSYIPTSRFTNNPLYEPHFDKKKSLHFYGEGEIENYYLFLKAGGMKFLVITLNSNLGTKLLYGRIRLLPRILIVESSLLHTAISQEKRVSCRALTTMGSRGTPESQFGRSSSVNTRTSF